MFTRRRLLVASCVAVVAVVLGRRPWGTPRMQPIVDRIDAIRSLDNADDLDALVTARDMFFAHPATADHLGVWFRLFERFPEDDGYGVLWSVLHRVEAVPGYEQLAVESVAARPSRFPVDLVQRMVNSGRLAVGGVALLELLGRVAADEGCPASVREDARYFLVSRDAGR